MADTGFIPEYYFTQELGSNQRLISKWVVFILSYGYIFLYAELTGFILARRISLNFIVPLTFVLLLALAGILFSWRDEFPVRHKRRTAFVMALTLLISGGFVAKLVIQYI